MAEDDWVSWDYGSGGWVRFDASDWPGPVYARFADEDGRLQVRELYLDARGGALRSSMLRDLDLSALTALAASRWSESAERRLNQPGPDLSRLASHYRTSFGPQAHNWVADSYRAQVKNSTVQQAPMGKDPQRPAWAEREAITLHAPEEGLTDDFLRDVAAAYIDALSRGKHPAPVLAAQAGVSPRTVHAWVAKARDRGILPRASKGSVS